MSTYNDFSHPKVPKTDLIDENIAILYEDLDFLIVYKPSELPSHRTLDKKRKNLFDCVKSYIQKENINSSLHLPHRLDVGTSGAILFCKNKDLNKPIDLLFSDRKVKKTYWALSTSKPKKPNWTIETHMKSAVNKSKMEVMQETQSGGQYSLTDFTYKKDIDGLHWIEAFPKTGRKHQIRLHLKLSQCSIYGDPLYNKGYAKSQGRLRLHAYEISFPDPRNLENIISVQAPLEMIDNFWHK